MTGPKFAELIQKVMTMSAQDLQAWLAGPDPIPLEEEIFIKHVLDLAENPNWFSYEKYLTRRLGKPPETIRHEGDGPVVTHAAVFRVLQEFKGKEEG